MTSPLRSSFAALVVGLCLVAGAAGCGSGSGSGTASAAADDGKVSVQAPTVDWPANPSVAAVRMVIRNGTGTDDELLSVASPVAKTVTVHRTQTDAEGRSTMVEQPKLAIPARSSVTFEPGGLHVMLTGITDDLQVGDDVPLTLTFEHAGTVTATAKVIQPGSAPEGTHDH
ncbi:copper chaperone PCu(A)C [Aquihabitans sp. McL0605]|uniref:copper chaperone PCu(A)C n=1 Tax=Aquihabitans sp. McL0605 TaxID=3415671 RepID=UPI003CF88D35